MNPWSGFGLGEPTRHWPTVGRAARDFEMRIMDWLFPLERASVRRRPFSILFLDDLVRFLNVLLNQQDMRPRKRLQKLRTVCGGSDAYDAFNGLAMSTRETIYRRRNKMREALPGIFKLFRDVKAVGVADVRPPLPRGWKGDGTHLEFTEEDSIARELWEQLLALETRFQAIVDTDEQMSS